MSEPDKLIRLPALLWTRLALYIHPEGIDGRKRVPGVRKLVCRVLERFCDEKGIP